MIYPDVNKAREQFEKYMRECFGFNLIKITNKDSQEYVETTTLLVQQVYHIFLHAYSLGMEYERDAMQAVRMRPITEWQGVEIFITEKEPTTFGRIVPNRVTNTNAIAGETNKRGVK